MAETANTTTLLETLETSADAMREPDYIGRTPRQGMAMGEHPKRLLACSRKLDTENYADKPLF